MGDVIGAMIVALVALLLLATLAVYVDGGWVIVLLFAAVGVSMLRRRIRR